MSKQYRSRVMASIHETAEGLTAAGVMCKQTLHEFDELSLNTVRAADTGEIRDVQSGERAIEKR
jgi:putative transcriptional regulator